MVHLKAVGIVAIVGWSVLAAVTLALGSLVPSLIRGHPLAFGFEGIVPNAVVRIFASHRPQRAGAVRSRTFAYARCSLRRWIRLRKRGRAVRGLQHSLLYQDPRVARDIAHWIREVEAATTTEPAVATETGLCDHRESIFDVVARWEERLKEARKARPDLRMFDAPAMSLIVLLAVPGGGLGWYLSGMSAEPYFALPVFPFVGLVVGGAVALLLALVRYVKRVPKVGS